MSVRRVVLGDSVAALRERLLFVGLLLVSGVLDLWKLSISGWANSFYSAAAQAGSTNWESFFYGSSDAANSITVDKPPLSLWFMDASVRLFGLSSESILVPEALMGVATVAVVYLTVRRAFSANVALLAGGILALTPVAALMFRFNNPDALLALTMALALYFTLRGIESGRLRWVLWAGAMVGLGFLTKQLQAFLILPVVAGVYLAAAPGTWWRRIWHLLAALAAVIVSAGWWVAIVTLVPAGSRPYIGGSQTNSFLELTFGYNGLGRLDGTETGSVTAPTATGPLWGATGITRLFEGDTAGQIGWLLPGGLLMAVAALVLLRGGRTDLRRAALLLLTADVLVTGFTFSFAAGIFHQYYTVALAPPVAGMVAVSSAVLWERRDERIVRLVAAAAMLLTIMLGFGILDGAPAFLPWLVWVMVGVGLIGVVLLLAPQTNRAVRTATIAAVWVAALVGPAAWTVETVITPHTGAVPTAGPLVVDTTSTQAGGLQSSVGTLLGSSRVPPRVRRLLQADASNYTWVAAAVGSNSAAGFQLATQHPVMPVGGFNGSDPSPTLAQFKSDVANGLIHYFVGSALPPPNGGSTDSEAIDRWVRSNFTVQRVDGVALYDLSN